MSWTRTTLATHLMGELNDARNAAGGTVPDRLANLVHEAYKDLWAYADWRFRRRRTTFPTVASTATVALPADFEKLDQEWVKENNADDARLISFTDSPTVFERYSLAYGTNEDEPAIALIEPTTTDSAYREQIRLTPTPDAIYTYDYWYLCTPPTLAAGGAALWPARFEDGWLKLARAYTVAAFRRKDKEEALAEQAKFHAWLVRTQSVDNEAMVSSTPLIQDATGDSLPFASVGIGFRRRVPDSPY